MTLFLRNLSLLLPRWLLLYLLTTLPLVPQKAQAWGEPHLAITKAALETLPPWQKDWLGAEFAALGDNYCLIPDHVYTDIENGKFARMESEPGVVYLRRLHVPSPEQPENLETFRYFMGKAVAALQAGEVGNAARYMGTVCHTIEDFGSPAHTVPGDNMFTLLQQFMPPPEKKKGKLLHSLIENGDLKVGIAGYQPRLLGDTVEEASWRLLHRVHGAILNARSTTIPIIQALYAEDTATVKTHQLKAATVDAQVAADAVYTMLCLGAGKFDEREREALRTAGITWYFPVEAVSLFYPQTHFSGSPNWGHAQSGVVLEGGTEERPLKLRFPEKDTAVAREFTEGISPSMGKPLTYLLPAGVFHYFTVQAGLHPELGAKGKVEFSISSEGRILASATVSGSDSAQTLECDITGVTRLQLNAVARGSDPKSNYAIWAEPILSKRPKQ